MGQMAAFSAGPLDGVPRMLQPLRASMGQTRRAVSIRRKIWSETRLAVRVDDVAPSGYSMDRATIRQKKTGRPVRFEPTDQTRMALDDYLRITARKPGQFLFAGRRDDGKRGLTTRQYARLVQEWVASIGLDPAKFGTHSLGRTKAVLIYRRTGNLRAVQLLLGHTAYCPRTPNRSQGFLPVSSPMR